MSRPRRTIHYDKKSRRFRDAKGRFISKSRAMRSSVARREYAKASKRKPRKKKLLPAKVCELIPHSKLPEYGSGPVVVRDTVITGQTKIFGVGRWGICSLANLILQQIKKGQRRFRFWYKIVKSGFIYTDTTRSGSKIGSTTALDSKFIAFNQTLEEVISFLQGRGNQINGRVIYYWMSKRI